LLFGAENAELTARQSTSNASRERFIGILLGKDPDRAQIHRWIHPMVRNNCLSLAPDFLARNDKKGKNYRETSRISIHEP